MKNFSRLVISIIICELAGIGGAFFTSPAVSSDWYKNLAKPGWQPPSWLFSPVWITIYALMGVALFLVWKEFSEDKKKEKKLAIIIFFIQLILNIFWSIIFFGMRSPGGAFFEIIFLWLAILITMIYFSKISRLAAWLFIPYILWVSFAAFLNFTIYSLN